MGGFVLTAAGQQAPVPVSLTGNHVFWLGVALASLVALFTPVWIRAIMFVVALFASGLFQSTVGHGHFTSAEALTILILVIGLLVGLYFGRVRGLRHLGEYEFGNRLGYIRTISRWF
jgi:hypothetical protein